ncbi:MAG: hypothetical protein KQH53_18910 [Desulfarculaceae bacterium]|nr:hypothetical protein [Desulfarculaceae bacterium]
MVELQTLAARLCGLLEPWAPPEQIGQEGLELAAGELAALRAQVDQGRLELATQVKKAREALAEADAMAGAAGKTAPALRRARQGAAGALQRLLERLGEARRHLELLDQASELYPQIIKQARSHLAAGLTLPAPPAHEALDLAWQAHREARRAQGRCARLSGLARRIRAARPRLEDRAAKLHRQAAELNRDLAQRRERLAELEEAALMLAPGESEATELEALRAGLAGAVGAARELNRRCRENDQALERHHQRLLKVSKAWAASRERWSEHAARRSEAAGQALSLARERGRGAESLELAAQGLGELLWPLRPAELAPELENLAVKARALRQAAEQEQAQALRLQKGDEEPAPLPDEEDGKPPASQAPPVDLAGLAELSQQADNLAEAQRAAVREAREKERERLRERAGLWAGQLRQARLESRRLHALVAEIKAGHEAARQQERRAAEAELARARAESEAARQKEQEAAAQRAEAEDRHREEVRALRRKAADWGDQLRRARAEARRLQELTARLKAGEEAARREGRAELAVLQAEAQSLREQVERLSGQLSTVALMATLAPPRSEQPVARVVVLDPEQVESFLARVGKASRRLAKASRHTLGQLALILALGCGLVLALPGLPATATLRDHILRVSTPRLSASALAPAPEARLELNLVPLTSKLMPLALLDDKAFTGLADQAGMSPYSLYYSARRDRPGLAVVDSARLEELAEQAKALKERHPGIFADMRRGGLPAGFGELVAASPAAPSALDHFSDRLYQDYRRLGYGRGEALTTVAASRRAATELVKSEPLPSRYYGRVRPIRSLESMGAEEFLARLSPYIADRCRAFLALMGRRAQADLEGYARDLAFDMYAAAKKFGVPVSYLLTIAHQETFYANVLGDDNRSASPFQIWRPTLPRIIRSMRAAGFAPPPQRINLQHHLTIATELAAFHLRELMQDAVVRAGKRHPAYVDMDKVMLRYNGSRLYAGRVAVRRAELDRFLAKAGS